ncbi:Lrp/AsnC family transcriptional regulator [Streptomonospora litoralis]|uniref:AsnC family protein n=1 Tax=Streptomonospora litoralis TaxID=2498135 RepID=A0A4V0ZKE3_9ACTN|nr:AsnC family transcriptional regulator [Streptomonospora litoralis]QBI56682.1 AsnC family protein [Streptomonospora litoralis]
MDELDLALINAVQLSPRASWAELAEPLETDPSTLSRRWARLSADGEAWVTCYPGPPAVPTGAMAFIEVACRAGGVTSVAERLARHPHALNVEIVSGEYSVLVTAAAVSTQALSVYAMDVAAAVPGVRAVRLTPVARTASDGSHWRLDALDRGQQSAIGGSARDGRRPVRSLAGEREVMLALGEDGRMPYAQLSRRTGIPANTLRRRLAELLATQRLVLRCDTASSVAGWPVLVTVWLGVPAGEVHGVCADLTAMPETRMAATTAGRANAAAVLWLHRLEDLHEWERRLAEAHPGAVVQDRLVTVRQVKRMGRLIGADGRGVGHVPMDVWAEPAEAGEGLSALPSTG